MIFDYEWDPAKAAANLQKHGISIEEAATVFELGLILTVEDIAHSEDEERFVSIGVSSQGKVLVVIHTERVRVIRIISARSATNHERRVYENNEF